MAGQSRRVDFISLPTYPVVQDRGLGDYLHNLTVQLQTTCDQLVQAVDNGLIPYQAIQIAVTVSNGSVGQIETFAVPLPAGTLYTAIAVPHWAAGGVWVSPTSVASFTVNWQNSPPTTSTMDLVVVLTQLLP